MRTPEVADLRHLLLEDSDLDAELINQGVFTAVTYLETDVRKSFSKSDATSSQMTMS
jgi:hypothetical protein